MRMRSSSTGIATLTPDSPSACSAIARTRTTRCSRRSCAGFATSRNARIRRGSAPGCIRSPSTNAARSPPGAADASSGTREATRRWAGHSPRQPRTSWWTRKRTVQISALGGLAMVAGIAGLVVLGSIARDWSPGRSDPRAPVARVGAAAETVHVVRFVFSDREAQAVSLVGDFNAWSKSATPLVEQTGTGTWVVTLELPRGRHEYAFVVHRGTEERWAADPFGVPVRDEFGTESSIVTVDAPRSPIARVTTS